MAKTLAELTSTIREINVEKGWRLPDGPLPGQTIGDRIALLHSEVSEALEALRDHGLSDVTGGPEFQRVDGVIQRDQNGAPVRLHAKPEGVGSELADVFIRLADLCDVFGVKLFDMDMQLDDVASITPSPMLWRPIETFAEHLAWLHREISALWLSTMPNTDAAFVLRVLVTVARKADFDLNAEVERKIAYNRTRSFRHGNRAL